MSETDIVVRKAKIDDLDALVGLLKELFSIEKDFEFNEVLQRKGLMAMLHDTDDRHVIVAQHQEYVIGMSTMQVLISTAEGGRVGLIEDMVVDKAFQGRGIGRKILTAMHKIAEERGLLRIQLLADVQNKPALKFYKKMGWFETRLICYRKKSDYLD